jgi:hypothetical protein
VETPDGLIKAQKKVMHKPTRVIPEIIFDSKNMETLHNCNFSGLTNGSITVPPNTNSKIFPAYSHDVHSLIPKIGASLEGRNSSFEGLLPVLSWSVILGPDLPLRS